MRDVPATSMEKSRNAFGRFLVVPAVTFAVFVTLGLGYWLLARDVIHLAVFLYLGVFTTGGAALYALLRPQKKHIGRRVAFFGVGLALLLGMGVFGRTDVQIEGFWFYLLAGAYAGTVTHYLVGKILGPILLHRGWCGWGCWTMMVLDLLPFKTSPGRVGGKWGWVRYGHFGLSLALVLALWLGFHYGISRRQWDIAGLYWVVGGNAFYYALAIPLAYALKDNRAFCKYACPITVFLKASCALSVVRIKGDRELCTECGACVRRCPMDIRIPEYAKAGQRVLSTECVMCLTCVAVCPQGALRASLGLDLGGKEMLAEKTQAAA